MLNKFILCLVLMVMVLLSGCTKDGNQKTEEKKTSEPPIDRITYEEGYTDAEVYTGEIPGEREKPSSHVCFPGDWSRKAESSRDKWLGMEGVVVLPYFSPDRDRYDAEGKKYLDNPSIYFGGNAGFESDVGLTWEIGCEADDCSRLSTEKFTFRPFWRYIHGGENIWANADDYDPTRFYFPGDVLRISVFSPRPHYLQLKIEVIEPTKDIKYVRLRNRYGVKYPNDFLSPEFPSNGHGVGNARFMRVNAIDQYYNEGKPSQPTNAEVHEMIWKEVYLYRKIDDTVYKVPFTSDRYFGIGCPVPEAFTISYDGVDQTKGGEKVIIHPGKVNN